MNSFNKYVLMVLALLVSLTTHAALQVKSSEPKTTGQKTIIKLELKNTFSEKIESVRASVFLLDDQGKVSGQATRWIIGGTKDKPALEPDAKTNYEFVVTAGKPFTKTKVMINRIVLAGGKLADVNTEAQIQPVEK